MSRLFALVSALILLLALGCGGAPAGGHADLELQSDARADASTADGLTTEDAPHLDDAAPPDTEQGDEQQSDEQPGDDAAPLDTQQSDAQQSDEQQSDAQQSDEQQSDEQQSDEQQSDEQQSDEQQSDAQGESDALDADGGDGWVEEDVAAPIPAIDDFVREQMQSQKLVGLSLVVVENGAISYKKGFGYADREAQLPTLVDATLFRWASISKTLTAVTALRLVRQQVVDLDADIRTHYPSWTTPSEWVEHCGSGTKLYDGVSYDCLAGYFTMPVPQEKRTISLRQLLGHLAGIPHYTNGKGNPTPPASETADPQVNDGIAWTIAYLVDKPLVSVPGESYNYSTFGFNLAGVVLEAAAKTPFATLVFETIVKPLALGTLQPDYEWATIPGRATGYLVLGNWAFRDGSIDVSWKLPGGGYISTAIDMARYCIGLTDETLLDAGEKTLAFTTQLDAAGKKTGYGLGFFVGSRNGHPFVEHSGEQQKARTQMRLYPAEKLCIVVMSNTVPADIKTILSGVEDRVRNP